MKRVALGVAVLVGLALAYLLAHWTLIEAGREVITLRTREPDSSVREARLWIIDDGGGAWLHGDRGSQWVQNLLERPGVEIVRDGTTERYEATPAPGPHPELHARLREKYGIADWWVRLVGSDRESTLAIRLEREPAAR